MAVEYIYGVLEAAVDTFELWAQTGEDILAMGIKPRSPYSKNREPQYTNSEDGKFIYKICDPDRPIGIWDDEIGMYVQFKTRTAVGPELAL